MPKRSFNRMPKIENNFATESNGADDEANHNEIRGRSDVGVNMDYEKREQVLAKFICSEGLPNIVSLLKELNPLSPLGSVKQDCLKIYEDDKLRVKNMLTNMDGQISLSVDVLTYYRRSGADDVFACLAAHFIDDKWKLKRWVLGFRCLYDEEDDEILHSAILKSLKDWDIESKVSSLTLAESDVYDEMVKEIKDGVQDKKGLPLNGQLFCVKCCAEMFNLMADDAYKAIADIVSKVSLLISWKFAPVWYLTANKLKEALELESRGEFSSENVHDDYDVPSSDEWEKVKCVCKLVESAEAVAKSVFLTEYPTANIFLHNLEELRAILFQETICSDSFTSKVATKMLKRLDKYLKDMFFVLAIASVMDPRLKMRYIEYLSSKSERSDGNSKCTLVLDAIRTLFSDYVNRNLEKENSVCDSTFSDSKEQLTRSTERGVSNKPNWLQENNQFDESNSQPPKSELDRYLEETVVSWSQDFNVLRWWRDESPKYPILSKMARNFLAVPMSVATSYEAFSTIPREVEPQIIASGPALRGALMCTRSWA